MEGVRPAFAPRARWVIGILVEALGRDVRWTDGPADIVYAPNPPAGGVWIPADLPAQAFFEGAQAFPGAAVHEAAGLTLLFPPSHPDRPVPGDVVASAFYLLARWDELHVVARDRFGRLPLADSAFGRIAGLDLEEPAVEAYVALLRRLLALPAPAEWSVALTHDIDRIRRRTAKGLASTARRRGPRAAAALALGPDPWDNVPDLLETEWVRGVRSTVFLIGRNAHPLDGTPRRAYERGRGAMAAAVRAAGGEVGLHGSFASSEDGAALAAELAGLRAETGLPVAGVRFHYLRFRYHETVRWLEAAGARYDSSLAFSEAPGFAAGIARPFRPWIVGEERPADLTLLPLAVMDTTLHSRLGLGAEAAGERALRVLDRVRAAGGRVALLWHNTYLADDRAPGYGALWGDLLDALAARGARLGPAGDPEAPGGGGDLRGRRVVHVTSVHRPRDVRIFHKEARAAASAGARRVGGRAARAGAAGRPHRRGLAAGARRPGTRRRPVPRPRPRAAAGGAVARPLRPPRGLRRPRVPRPDDAHQALAAGSAAAAAGAGGGAPGARRRAPPGRRGHRQRGPGGPVRRGRRPCRERHQLALVRRVPRARAAPRRPRGPLRRRARPAARPGPDAARRSRGRRPGRAPGAGRARATRARCRTAPPPWVPSTTPRCPACWPPRAWRGSRCSATATTIAQCRRSWWRRWPPGGPWWPATSAAWARSCAPRGAGSSSPRTTPRPTPRALDRLLGPGRRGRARWAPPAARRSWTAWASRPQARGADVALRGGPRALRVLYVSQYFVNADQPGGVRHWQHTRALARAGHDVTVVTSYVQHKERTVPERYRGRRMVHEVEDGIDVWRTYSTPGYGRDLRSRISNYGTFAWWSALAGLRAPRPDVVVASSPSLPSAAAAAALARARGARFVLEVRDLFPDSAIAMGLLTTRASSPSPAASSVLLPRADRIVALTEGIRDGIVAQGFPPAKVALITNGVDLEIGAGARTHPRRARARRRLRGDVRRRPRHLQLARDGPGRRRPAARRPATRASSSSGAGTASPRCVEEARAPRAGERRVRGLRCPSARCPPGWRARTPACCRTRTTRSSRGRCRTRRSTTSAPPGRSSPSAPAGELTRMVERAGCGVAVPPEDGAALAGAIRALAADREGARRMGARGRAYALEHYDRARARRAVRGGGGVRCALTSSSPSAAAPSGRSTSWSPCRCSCCSAPVMAALGLLVRRDSPGPALFRQRRIGFAGRPFTLLKFRTMVVGAEGMGAGLAVLAGDDRITPLGPHPAPAVARRAAPAVEHRPRRHEPGGPAADRRLRRWSGTRPTSAAACWRVPA